MCGCVSVCGEPSGICVYCTLCNIIQWSTVESISSAIISKRFHFGSGRFEPSRLEVSNALDQTHAVSLAVFLVL